MTGLGSEAGLTVADMVSSVSIYSPQGGEGTLSLGSGDPLFSPGKDYFSPIKALSSSTALDSKSLGAGLPGAKAWPGWRKGQHGFQSHTEMDVESPSSILTGCFAGQAP